MPTACCAWGLSLCTGMLERNGRDLDGRFSGEPPPPFWPDADRFDELLDGQRSVLRVEFGEYGTSVVLSTV